MIEPLVVEIAVQDAAGARSALAHGADRLELCQALGVGGLTPSWGLLQSVVDAVEPRLVNVLVRPRGGGFVYTDEEVAVVASDIAASTALGVGGVVVGALTVEGLVDREAVRRWRDAAGSAALVFHRAIDAAPDPAVVFEALLEEGVDRVLTSGGAARSADGIPRLSDFVQRGGGAIEVMAGGGVRVDDITALRRAGVRAVHLSARSRVGTSMPSGPGGGEDGHDETDAALVGAAAAAARR
ncbi:copper homeostasis protein CutC [Planococcus sp. APC 4015]|nr:copper homeostasis protein CutC [Planococcus sp. APC 4015]